LETSLAVPEAPGKWLGARVLRWADAKRG